MKTRTILAFTAVASLLFAGCATPRYKAGHATSKTLEQASRDVQAQKLALELTSLRLADLSSNPGADLRVQVRSFASAVDRLDKASRRSMESGMDVRETSTRFLEKWDQEIGGMNYEVIRNCSQTRKNEVTQNLDQVCRRYAEVQDVVQPVITYLRDIEKALGTDATLEGVAALKPIAANARRNADVVNVALDKLADSLATFSNRMSPVIGTNQVNELAGK